MGRLTELKLMSGFRDSKAFVTGLDLWRFTAMTTMPLMTA